MNLATHNTENPVTFEQAKKELNVSAYYLTALRSRLGIRGRIFMLSPIRDFLSSPEGREFSTFSYRKKADRPRRLEFKSVGNKWLVTMPGNPDVMAEDKSLQKALAQAGAQLEAK